MSDTKPNGQTCPMCGATYGENAMTGGRCTRCRYELVPAIIEPCPFPREDEDKCEDENHHYGRHDHVREVAR